jgi:hypothetical protein
MSGIAVTEEQSLPILFFDVRKPGAQVTWGLMKAFVSFGLQKKFVRPAGTDGPFPAIEGGKDQEGACFSMVKINSV